MDFTSRNAQPAGVVPNSNVPPVHPQQHNRRNSPDSDRSTWFRAGVVALVGIVVVLLIGVILVISSAGDVNNESKYVDTGKLQAIFLNTGQVYFGNIKSLNNKYFVLTNIYYLQTSSLNSATASSSSTNNVPLVKLGCELHRPYDQMVISAGQITFWENLQSDGQVAKDVAAFEQKNPHGQKCSDQMVISASPTNSNSALGATTTSGIKSGQ